MPHCFLSIDLPSLSVTNDQLSLSTANGHQTVYGFDTSLHGLPHRDTGDDARGLQTHTSTLVGTKWALVLKDKRDEKMISQ